MCSFRPNFWEATSHIKRVQPTSARGSTLILNLSDLIPRLRFLCFCFFSFRDHLTSQRVNLLSQRLHLNSGSWRPDPTTALASKSSALPTGRTAHNMGAHFKSPLRWLFDTSYPHTFIWTLVYTARELRLTNTLWIIFSPKHNYVKLFFL